MKNKCLKARAPAAKNKSQIGRINKKKFQPDIRTANAVISAVLFLQKTGIAGTPKNIQLCMRERSRKPFGKLSVKLQEYLSRGLELGILKKYQGHYKLGVFGLRRRRRKMAESKKKIGKTTDDQEVLNLANDKVEDSSSNNTEASSSNNAELIKSNSTLAPPSRHSPVRSPIFNDL